MFLSKIKNLTRFRKKGTALIDISTLSDQINTGLFDVMEKSFTERFTNTSNSGYTQADVQKIINGYARKNTLLATATSLVPGPLGILGAVPELLLNFKNQMGMIYDLGCAYNKEEFINKDLLLDIPIAALGGNTNLMALQNQSKDLLDSPKQVLLGKAQELGKGIIQRNLKKSVVQFIPVGGAVLMGIWAKMSTNKIAKISNNFLDHTQVYAEAFTKEATPDILSAIQIEKIKGLANLIEVNEEINEDQIAFIGPIIENAAIPQGQKNHLLEESLKVGSNFQLDFQLLKEYEEADNLLMEMVVMAKRSGYVDELEKQYIFQVAKDLQIESSLVKDLIA